MARGKLSVTDKYAVQGMIHDKKPIAEIAEAIGRAESTVEKYVNEELEGLVETIARAQVQAAQAEVVEEESMAHASEEDVENAIVKLRQAGVKEHQAQELVDRVLRSIEFDIDSARQLYTLCIRSLNAKDVMITETTGQHRPGVTIMTKAASERGDDASKANRGRSRTARGNVFNPKQGKMAD